MNYFFLVPYAEISQQMLNLSTSRKLSSVPVKIYNQLPFYLLETSEENSSHAAFGNYERLFADEIDAAIPIIPAQKISHAGIFFETAPASQATSFDYIVPVDRIVSGAMFKAFLSTPGDKIKLEAYDPLGTLLGTYVENFYVHDEMINLPVPKSFIMAGIKLRLIYTSVGAVAPQFYMNMLWSSI